MGFLFSNITLQKVVKMLNKAVDTLFCVSIYVQKILSTHGMILEQTHNYFFAPFCSFFSVKPRKGSAGHKHRPEAGTHGKCRLCSVHQSSPVCGSDGHTYSSKARARVVFNLSHSTRFSHSLSQHVIFSAFPISLHNSVCFHPWKGGYISPRNTTAAVEPLSCIIYGLNI